ncbi:glycosyltransferase family A protein [Muriicola marianensis]|uniref:Glycosyltransferase family 2 protein n=1 Tax=Muriicola marianensis TaxID=1324801 RepID=A0ABQ1QT15_9FLAO|nr:glycosyltransferase family A protein [Muriicola marianensis]GGD40804.1 hypothetical protein GCM10011361_04920 [Muriicola marianensis]
MFVFVIPVKSSVVSNDWALFSKLLERTLRSVVGQTNPNFKVIISCHEIPTLDYSSDKLIFHQVSFPSPVLDGLSAEEKNRTREDDKARKILEGLSVAMKFDPEYVMVLDSDDCVHKNLVERTLNSGRDVPGWYMKQGYIYRESANIAFQNLQNFHTLCGSSIIVKPRYLKAFISEEPLKYYHHEKIRITDQADLLPFPYPAVVYSIGNGENHLMTVQQAKAYNAKYRMFSKEYFKSLIRKLRKYRPRLLTRSFRKNYGLYKINRT